MLFALKDEQNNIVALSDRAISDEWIPASIEDDAVNSFLKNNPEISGEIMEASDADFIRVLEDVIDLLIDKSVMQFTELPDAVQSKLLNRRKYREQLIGGNDTTHLMDTDDNLF